MSGSPYAGQEKRKVDRTKAVGTPWLCSIYCISQSILDLGPFVDAMAVLLKDVVSRAGGKEKTKRRNSMCPILQRVSF